MQTPSDSVRGVGGGVRIEEPKPSSARSVFGNYRSAPDEEVDGADADSSRELLAADVSPQPSAEMLQVQIDQSVARGFIYRFLAKAFEDPNKAGWIWLTDPQAKLPLMLAVKTLARGAPAEGAMPRASEVLFAALIPQQYEAFSASFIAAFGHTVRGDCPMNEIEYGDIKADPLFQPHRLADLAAFYSAFGLQISEDAGERQDHICLELEFMSVLTAKEAFALESQLDPEHLEVCRDAQKKFLREHLGRWTPAFSRRLRSAAGDGALGALADFTREFVVSECRRFGVTPGGEDLMLRPVDETAEKLCDSCGINNLPPGALQTT